MLYFVAFCCILLYLRHCCILLYLRHDQLSRFESSQSFFCPVFCASTNIQRKYFFFKDMSLKFKENIFISQRNIKESIQSFPCPVVCASSNIQRSLVPIPTPLQILISQIRKQISESTQSFHPQPSNQTNQTNKNEKQIFT